MSPASAMRGVPRRAPRPLRCAAALLLILAGLLGPIGPSAGESDALPRILAVGAPARLRVGDPGGVRLTYHAPEADVVAVIQELEDLDGPLTRRATRQREVGVIARAYGFEAGELVLPVAFGTPGRKRVTLTLVTEARRTSEPAAVEIVVFP